MSTSASSQQHPANSKYPNLSQALYEARDLDEAYQIYIKMLRATGNIYHAQYAAKLEQSRRTLSAQNLRQLERDFIVFKDHMKSWSTKSKIKVILQRRQKDFLGLNSKIRLFLSSGRSLSKINDLLGFRIIVKTLTPDNAETIRQCYETLNETIQFFALNDCIIMEAEPRSGDEISAEEAKELGIVIPSSPSILTGFENNVKDYIAHPKQNGYQSLHILIQTQSNLIFEVQIRTVAMDILADLGLGDHTAYKLKKYQATSLGEIEFERISRMSGFKVLPNGEIYDKIGLQKAVDPFNLLY